MATEFPRSFLSENRAEEYGHDIWERFVVPRYFDQLDLHHAKKPRLVIGGRGCGKTMLLRYLSHETTFSNKRKNIPQSAINHIGLYWRTDTQFASAMQLRSLDDDIWASAFNHYVALILSMEVLNSLESIAQSTYTEVTIESLRTLSFDSFSAFDPSLPGTYQSLQTDLMEKLWSFESWVNNVRKRQQPTFLPGPRFVSALIDLLRTQLAQLRDATFYVYIDEYENLCDYQQKHINTWLKHSQSPLIFNVAVKRNAISTFETLGAEQLSDIHDFRSYDLEDLTVRNNFPLFAAEILLLNFAFADLQISGVTHKIEPSVLRDPGQLESRRRANYSKKLLAAMDNILPQLSHEEVGKRISESDALWNSVQALIADALKTKGSKQSPVQFMSRQHPAATVVLPALLHRRDTKPDELLTELHSLENGAPNHFLGRRNWVHNNFFGSVLNLYAPFGRACPLYSGFSAYCLMAKGNLRHFLELCHRALSRIRDYEATDQLPVSTEIQATAAKQASGDLLGEVKSFGRRGPQLHTFVVRLGTLFQAAHRRTSQSEPEQNHFTIRRGSELTDEDKLLLNEAAKWSVLFEETATKRKEVTGEAIDYLLNPIYAPYFTISYRRKRKLELTEKEVSCLLTGTLDEFTGLLRSYLSRWRVAPPDETLSLFPEEQHSDT